MSLRIDAIRECFEGAVPATLGTCGGDGLPNAAVISQVQYVDPDHVAISPVVVINTPLPSPYITPFPWGRTMVE